MWTHTNWIVEIGLVRCWRLECWNVVMLAIGIGFVDVWGITVDPADWIGINMVLTKVLVMMLELEKKVKLKLFWVKLLTCFLTLASASGPDSASYWCQFNQQSRPSSPNNQTQSQSPTPRHPTFQSPIQSLFIIKDDLFTFDVDTVWTKSIQVPYNFNGKYG